MKRTIAVTGAIGLAVFMGACAEDDTNGTTNGEDTVEMTTEETTVEETTVEETDDADADAAEGNIVETAVAAGDFTTLTQALEAAGLVETLEGPGPFTVFAPTDDGEDQ